MAYASNHGIRIWYEVDGNGPPLLLHIGFAGWLENWIDAGYVAALRDLYRLILLDPRGQGRSDRPPDPMAYTTTHRVDDVLAVMDAMAIERAHLWGYSLGGRVGFALSQRATDRVASLVIGGASPFGGYPRPVEGDGMLASLQKGMEGLVAEWEAAYPECWLSPGERERTLASDADALAAAWRARLEEPDMAPDDVASIEVPALLYAGTRDTPESVERAARLMPNAEFVPMPGLDHAQAFERSDLILPHVQEFLARPASGAA